METISISKLINQGNNFYKNTDKKHKEEINL